MYYGNTYHNKSIFYYILGETESLLGETESLLRANREATES
jgi:hypothetical protein